MIGIKSQELLQCNNNFEKLNRVFNIHGREIFSPPIFRVTTNTGREYFHLTKMRGVTKTEMGGDGMFRDLRAPTGVAITSPRTTEPTLSKGVDK